MVNNKMKLAVFVFVGATLCIELYTYLYYTYIPNNITVKLRGFCRRFSKCNNITITRGRGK